MMKHMLAVFGATAIAAMAASAPAAAQNNYPTQPVRLVVGFAPGGINDVLARLLAEPLGKRLGQQVIVENRAGGGSQIGIASVAKAQADGYTLLFGTSDGMTLIPAMQKTVPFDVNKDFTPISLIRNERGAALTVNPALGVKTFDDLVKLAKTKPGGLRYGSTGIRSTPHLQGLLFEAAVGAKQTHVPYGGAGPAVTALLANQIDLIFLTPTTAAPLHRDGKLLVVAQTNEQRHYLFKDVPTTREAGMKEDLAVDAWSAIFGPANLNPAIAERLSKELHAILKDPEIVKAFQERGVTIQDMTPAQLKTFVADMLVKWTKIAETHNLRE